ncbi:prohibitin family protein [Oscillochloris sp. ZM17-4]|uniref:prohibitin family protein n=1 Tax=Oscillochloris sp. ZM17-4 TaxID=2866714 RepID=UPI001C72C2ED|nr:prohibitin family protein [Oscillochloris sp. ZM17-4]MBX0326410.1 prohibitin family protein [Oscillochloris sp. ZM17-4]
MTRSSPPIRAAGGRIITLMIVAAVALLLLGLMFASWRNIEPGYVGIVFDKANHQVTAGALEPGWAFINPFTQAIQEYPVTIQNYAMVLHSGEGSAAGDDSIKIQSSEGQQLNLDVVIQYQVIRDEAGQLYQDWGGANISVVEDRVVRQYTRTQVPAVAAGYTWEQIVSSQRAEITNKITKALNDEFARRHLTLISFGVREVHLPDTLQQALTNKIEAQQQAEQQKYQLDQARIKADQDKVVAQGQAQALQAQAEGEAAATRIKADAQAEANLKLAKSLTPELIQYEQLQRWDGKLPVFTGGATPLIDASGIISGTVAP